MPVSQDDVRELRLDNGLRLLFEPMPWLPTLSATLLLPFGASTDPDGREGSATVLHDWIQRGAGELDSRAHSDALEGLGVRRGGHAGREATSLTASFLAEAMGEVLPLFAAMVTSPRLEDDEFEGARELALQELQSLADAPTQRLFEALLARFLEDGPARSAYGTEEGLAALDPEGVREDARRRLGPDGAILAVAGGVSWDALQDAVRSAFGGWRGDVVPLPQARARAPHREHVAAESAQTQIGLAFPAPAPGDPDQVRYDMALHVLSSGMGARLFSEVREKRGLVYSVAAVYRSLRRFGYTLGYAGTTPERADETLQVLQAELRRIAEGVTPEEFERARTGMLSSVVMQGESSGARSSRLAGDAFARGDARSLDEVRAAIEAVELEGLNRYLAEHPYPEATVVTLGPKSPVHAGAAS